MRLHWTSVVTIALAAKIVNTIELLDERADDGSTLECGDHVKFEKQRVKNRAGPGELPFLAEIQISHEASDKNVTCLGVLISPQLVLTSIKCSKQDAKYVVSVGSVQEGQGQKFKATRSSMNLLMSEEGECGDWLIRHGIVLLKLSEKLTFSLDNNNKATNEICLGVTSREDKVFAACWKKNDKRARMLPLESAECSNRTKSPQKWFCARRPGASREDYKDIQEGAPLIRYDSNQRWTLVGVHSKNSEPLEDCDDENKYSTANFISLVSDDSLINWIEQARGNS